MPIPPDARTVARWALLSLALIALAAAALLVMPTAASFAKIKDARREAFAEGDDSPDWTALRQVNGDVVAWLEVGGTDIDLPVVQPAGKASDHYLTRDLSGSWSPYGTPYLDRRCDADAGNLLVFGHNAGIAGGMFTALASAPARLDSLGRATWATPEDGESSFEPVMALEVDYRYSPIQEFLPMNGDELIDWLEGLEGDASAVVDGWRGIAEGSTRALSLVTCSTPWAGCTERVIVVFVA